MYQRIDTHDDSTYIYSNAFRCAVVALSVFNMQSSSLTSCKGPAYCQHVQYAEFRQASKQNGPNHVVNAKL